MKKIIALILVICICLCLASCGLPDGNIDTLLSPPEPTGELNEVWNVLKKTVGDKITLKYPSSGNFRSAIIEQDLDKDGVREAIAFYSSTADNVTSMHLHLVSKLKKEWVSRGDVSIVATGIEKIEFADINGDGKNEIIVSWNIYGGVEKSVGIYTFDIDGIKSRLLENHTKYICKDFDFDKNPDLLIINKDMKNSVMVAKLLDLTRDGVKEIGSCQLDMGVTEYLEPVTFTAGDKTAVYIDGIKGTGMITEMLIIDDGVISNLSYSPDNNTHFDTFREGSLEIKDINDDGNYDIPISFILTQSTDAKTESIYKTNWYSFDGKGISLSVSTVMNFTDGYYLEIPEKWDSTISVSSDSSDKSLSVSRLDNETGESAELLLKINATEKSDTLAPTFKGSTKIAENNNLVFYATLGSYKGAEAITSKELKNIFKIIS